MTGKMTFLAFHLAYFVNCSNFAPEITVGRLVAGTFQGERGKSGQRRASHFLTESRARALSNVEENNRLLPSR